MVASRHRLHREVLGAALLLSGFDVAASVPCAEACDALDAAPVDVLVYTTGDDGSAEVAEHIRDVRRSHPDLPVLAVLESEDDGMLFTSLDAGATAVVHRGQPLDQLSESIHSAAQRQSVLSPSLADKVLARVRSATGAGSRAERVRLSSREVAVLGGVARGMTNEQIARETSVSPSTVKNQLYSACRKLGVSSRSHAVAEAIRRGIIAPSGEPILAR